MTTIESPLALAEIDRLTDAMRGAPDEALERRLIESRYAAFFELDLDLKTGPPEISGDPLPLDQGLPSATLEGLDGQTVRKGILAGGCVLIRNAIARDLVAELSNGIDRALADMASESQGAYYSPFSPEQKMVLGIQRKWASACSSMLASDSPRVLGQTIAAYRASGLHRVISEYLGERPACSMKKTVLRRVDVDSATDWHQDGAFMGVGLNSLNVWLNLTDCGKTAPGLDLVPRRLDSLVETGTPGANFEWSAAPDKVAEAAGDIDTVRPDFKAGDIVLFDELCLHRTAVAPEMRESRRAIEMWCFPPSRYPSTQIPLVL
ncbi:MAG: phytanoyl-CoA dioxygenase family protein [Acidobacteria bacterium]|nr:phytanoyl-CoA dioxygenase family protein [Acidobacteriota bacterium]